MNRQQFIIMALFTAAETYYFNESVMEQRYIMAVLWAILILRNFRVSYIMGSSAYILDKIKAFQAFFCYTSKSIYTFRKELRCQ